ncbi:MAG: hypothetical protein IPO93_18505 [Actinobacteria bacterium]|nr:hypothetical protein [Actinomycetota bacterium]
MKTILLREYERRDTVQLEPAVCEVLRTVFKATVQPSLTTPGAVDIALADVVGTAAAGDSMIIVQPKIAISQVLFMLAYTADPSTWRADDVDLGTYDDVNAGLASLFAQVSERALRRGVLHGYHEVADDSFTVRGRIDLAQQLRSRPGLDTPLAVRYAEYDADILENRLLLAAGLVLHALRTRDADATRRLRRVIAGLAAETTFTRFHPAAVPTVTWTRLNIHYRSAVELARLILAQASPHLSAGTRARHRANTEPRERVRAFRPDRACRGPTRLGRGLPGRDALPAPQPRRGRAHPTRAGSQLVARWPMPLRRRRQVQARRWRRSQP